MAPQILEPLNPGPSMIPGLYIHIPFCLTKCDYCSFYSVTSLSLIPEFLEALCREMEMVPDPWGPFDTVYIGGGTPSLLSLGQLETILTAVRRRFVLLDHSEITLETNPGDFPGSTGCASS